jgi:hypothetical protein
VRAIYKTF